MVRGTIRVVPGMFDPALETMGPPMGTPVWQFVSKVPILRAYSVLGEGTPVALAVNDCPVSRPVGLTEVDDPDVTPVQWAVLPEVSVALKDQVMGSDSLVRVATRVSGPFCPGVN